MEPTGSDVAEVIVADGHGSVVLAVVVVVEVGTDEGFEMEVSTIGVDDDDCTFEMVAVGVGSDDLEQ
jgi:hypothetical protein